MVFDARAGQVLPDYGGALLGGIQAGQKIRKNVLDEQILREKLERERKAQALEARRQGVLSEIRPQVFSGTSGALEQYAGIDPKGALELQKIQKGQRDFSRQDEDARTDFFGKSAIFLKDALPEEKDMVYQRIQQEAVNRGYMSPDEVEMYSPQVERELEFYLNQSQDVKDLVTATKPPKRLAKEKQIERIMRTQGVDEKTAVSIADGLKRVVTDPVSGNAFLVDMIDGSSKRLSPEGFSKEDPPIAPSQSNDDEISSIRNENVDSLPAQEDINLIEASKKGTGAWSAMQDLYGRIVGQAFDTSNVDDTIEARQTLESAQNEMIRALSLNPRYPVAEINRIKKEFSIAPNVYDSPSAFKARLKAIRRHLTKAGVQAGKNARDTTLPADVRKGAMQSLGAIKSFLDITGLEDLENTEKVHKKYPGFKIRSK